MAERRLRRIARKVGNRVAPDEAALSATARCFIPFYSQRMSCAAVHYVAHRVRTVLQGRAEAAPAPDCSHASAPAAAS